MTKILTLVVTASLITQAPAQAPATPPPAGKPAPALSADAWYAKGQAAEKEGDPEAAKQAYLAALQANPKHANARYSLGQVKINADTIAATGRETKFGAVIVPEFNITDASLQETLDHLRTIVDKQSQGKVAANFVVQDPKKLLAEAKINLKLKNMPARAVMKYLMEQSGAKVRYEEFAIVIAPQ
ncbi:MAG: tetratricopeptide repeat protein [Verrucomicrobiota bacterium]